MKPNDEQIAEIRQWADQGETLGGIQSLLKEKHGIRLTYLDTRFLLNDLGIELDEWKPKPEPEPEPEAETEPGTENEPRAGAASGNSTPTPAKQGSPSLLDESGQPADSGAGVGKGVSVSVDKVTRPGAMVSGQVTFSDGKSMGWQFDAMGRIGLVPSEPGYQPPTADIPQFQAKLDAELRKIGL